MGENFARKSGLEKKERRKRERRGGGKREREKNFEKWGWNDREERRVLSSLHLRPMNSLSPRRKEIESVSAFAFSFSLETSTLELPFLLCSLAATVLPFSFSPFPPFRRGEGILLHCSNFPETNLQKKKRKEKQQFFPDPFFYFSSSREG